MKHAAEIAQPEVHGAPHRSTLPIIAVDRAGVITKANAAARKLVSASEGGVEGSNLGSAIADLIGSSDGHAATRLTLSSGSGEPREILLVLSEDGVTISPQPVAEPPPPPLARMSEGAMADFIAHELRNPLSAILGISQVLEDRHDRVSRDERQEALETIHAEADKALLILQGLLRLAEARTRDKVEMSVVPLHSVVRNVVAGHLRRNPHRFLTLSGDSPLFAVANSMWVELAISNLLSNAEKHTPRDRRVEVVFHQVGSWATILILDNGTGLRPELYRTLWNIYARGPEDGVNVTGSGIGLALCKELIESMDGHVWAGPGRSGGSVFALSLPSPYDMSVPPPLAATSIIEMESQASRGLTPVPAWR